MEDEKIEVRGEHQARRKARRRGISRRERKDHDHRENTTQGEIPFLKHSPNDVFWFDGTEWHKVGNWGGSFVDVFIGSNQFGLPDAGNVLEARFKINPASVMGDWRDWMPANPELNHALYENLYGQEYHDPTGAYAFADKAPHYLVNTANFLFLAEGLVELGGWAVGRVANQAADKGLSFGERLF